jgi:hypothetical protein
LVKPGLSEESILVQLPSAPNTPAPHVMMASVKDKHGHNVLYWWGSIVSGDAVRFQMAMSIVQPVEVVFLGSGGGSLGQGMDMGRIIHQAKLETHILPGVKCISACNFVFMGGPVRVIDEGGQFITHMFAREDAPALMLKDVLAALATGRPPDQQTPAGSGPAEAKSGDPAKPVSNAVGKIPPPGNLNELGCDVGEISSPYFETELALTEARLEGQKLPDDDMISYFRHEKEVPIKNSTQYAALHALALDYICLEQRSAEVAAMIARFVVEMRLSLKFLDRMTSIANASPVPLTREELIRYNVINTQ